MRIGVIGGGSWGTSLALLLAELENDVSLWFHNPECERQAREAGENVVYLPGFRFPARLKTTISIEEAARDSGLLVAACPSHVMREVMSGGGSVLRSRMSWSSAPRKESRRQR